MTLPLVVAITGASGVVYGVELLRVLKQLGHPAHLILSEAARMNLAIETDCDADEVEALATVVYKNKDVSAAVASGSFRTRGMIVAPCSIKTLSAIAIPSTQPADPRRRRLPQERKLVYAARDAAAQAPRSHVACGGLRRGDPAADAGVLSPARIDHGHHPSEYRQGARSGRHRHRYSNDGADTTAAKPAKD